MREVLFLQFCSADLSSKQLTMFPCVSVIELTIATSIHFHPNLTTCNTKDTGVHAIRSPAPLGLCLGTVSTCFHETLLKPLRPGSIAEFPTLDSCQSSPFAQLIIGCLQALQALQVEACRLQASQPESQRSGVAGQPKESGFALRAGVFSLRPFFDLQSRQTHPTCRQAVHLRARRTRDETDACSCRWPRPVAIAPKFH